MEVMTILWREWVFFKHRFFKITASQLVSPLLYLFTFGFAFGSHLTVEGKPYLLYLIPGIMAMTTMRTSYASVSMRVSITRLHEKSFETFIYAPTRMSHLAIGNILAGALRGMYSGLFIVAIGWIAGLYHTISPMLLLIMFLNSLIFAAVGFLAAMMIDTHYDLNNFANMVITPMSFLSGTFFSLSNTPWAIRWFIELSPLTQTTRLIRRLSFGYGVDAFSLLAVLLFCGALIFLSIRICYEEIKD